MITQTLRHCEGGAEGPDQSSEPCEGGSSHCEEEATPRPTQSCRNS